MMRMAVKPISVGKLANATIARNRPAAKLRKVTRRENLPARLPRSTLIVLKKMTEAAHIRRL
ncbi:hypothetical protein D3C71_2229980 [compost metagenome]